MKIKMDTEFSRNNNDNGSTSTSSSTSSSNQNTYNNLINTTNTTGIVDTSSTTSSSTSPNSSNAQAKQAILTPTTTSTTLNNSNECPSTNFTIEQLVQHQLANNNKYTLSRQQMFDLQHSHLLHHHHQQHDAPSQSPQTQHKFKNFTNQNLSQYVDLSQPQPNPPNLPPPPPMMHSTQATTAYLVQTPNGSALLIPPNNHFMQAAASQTQSAQSTGTLSFNRNPYGITTIPLQNAAILNQNSGANLPHSPSITSGNCFVRPESTASTNVYQTIDTEKNGYLYPLESFYEGTASINNSNVPSTYNNPLLGNTNTNNCSMRHKRKCDQQKQLIQQHYQIQQQQGSHLAKLIENHNSGTMHSNTNNTNSNFFVSPALSASSNRRLNGSLLERIKYRLSKKMSAYCSWKCVAMLFLCIAVIAFISFTVLLAIMRIYNLDWQLKDQQNNNNNNNQLNSFKYYANANHERKLAFLSRKIGDTIEDQIMPNEFFNVQFNLDSPMYIKFNLTISKNSNLGFYAEKHAPPTFTKFKYFETINGNSLVSKNTKSSSNKRATLASTTLTYAMVNTGFVHYLEEGIWYISLFNDNKNVLKFKLRADYHEYTSLNCPSNCNGKGECVNGKCKCYPGFSGVDCSSNTCPILCNGHGKYENGKCSCYFDWHGPECEIPIDQCEVANCNGNGICESGKCVCFIGYDGKSCEKQTCSSPNCSNNGICMNGQCICFSNYTGHDCSQLVKSINSLCSNHGDFDYASKSCACHRGWSAPDCSRNENCLDKSCSFCKNGWTGLYCLHKVPLSCDSRCDQHGICVNGTCTCSPGFQGRNCDINNCPNSCSSNGVCEKTGVNKYQCICNQGWTGRACDVAIEMICNDDIDNDKDGLTDCMDSECCVFESCKLSLACQTSPEPKDRLLRKQPPSLSATFFEKMRFLIEDGSVQSFANSNSFSESQVSVIRGQVLFKNGQPLIGVKVSCLSNPSYGYTLTRHNGIFDLMVNGGGSVLLEFSRNRLKSRYISVNAVWNQFVYVDPIVLYLSEDLNILPQPMPCKNIIHDSSSTYPIVKTSWKEIRTHYYDNSLVLPDSGVVRNELNIIDTNLKLVYTSNQVPGYSSTIFVLLTQNEIPDSLQLVHLQIVVEGVMHKQTFDALAELKYEYAWDRRNAYEQRVYGFTYAKVMVGYQYEDCAFVYWENKIVKLAGYDLGSSEIGSWNLDVHHRLNTQQGILHKGDGTTIYLKEIQKTAEIVAGQMKLKRDIDCSDCQPEYAKFYSPYSLSISKDGLIFIADYNYIWMLNNTELPKRVLALRPDQPYKYFIANELTNGNLYVTDSTRRLVYTVRNLEQINDLSANFKIASEFCGDNECQAETVSKKLQYPKSIAFDSNSIMYFIDGNQIKSINSDGLIKTIIGSDKSNIYRPLGCSTQFAIDSIRLLWPTILAVNPIDNSLYVLDEGLIFKITQHRTVELIAGLPYGCNETVLESNDLNSIKNIKNNLFRLHEPIDMAFSSDGDLYVLENDKKKVKQIRLIKSNGEMEVFYGENKLTKSAEYTFDFDQSSFSGFNDPIAIAVHQNRSVYVLDRGDNVLYHIKNVITRDEYTGKYTLVSPETKEAYLFNRFGHHLHTVDLISGNMQYNFTYNGNGMYAKLISVTDQSKVLLNIKRDFHGRVESLQTTNNYLVKVKLNNFDMLRSVTLNDNRSFNFSYLGNTGLLISKTEYDKTTLFNYEKNGKIKEIVEPNGQTTNITYFIDSSGIVTVLNRASSLSETWIVNSSAIYIYKNLKLDTVIEANKFNLKMRSLSNENVYNSFRIYFKSLLNFKQLSAQAYNSNNRQRIDDYGYNYLNRHKYDA